MVAMGDSGTGNSGNSKQIVTVYFNRKVNVCPLKLDLGRTPRASSQVAILRHGAGWTRPRVCQDMHAAGCPSKPILNTRLGLRYVTG